MRCRDSSTFDVKKSVPSACGKKRKPDAAPNDALPHDRTSCRSDLPTFAFPRSAVHSKACAKRQRTMQMKQAEVARLATCINERLPLLRPASSVRGCTPTAAERLAALRARIAAKAAVVAS